MDNFLIFCSLLVFVTLTIDGSVASCSRFGSRCSTNEECCPISNGKSYCNGESRKCDTVRYCDASSPKACPFNDLSSKELATVIKIIKQNKGFGPVLEFPIVRKQEPKKKQWNAGDNAAKERIAYAAVFDISNNMLSEVLISLESKRIISHKKVKDSMPLMTSYDYETSERLCQNDVRVKKAYERRGLNVSYAAFDHWANGAAGIIENRPERRIVKAVPLYKDPETRYAVWRPVEGILITVDVAEEKIISFTDKYTVPVPTSPLSYDSDNGHEMPSESVDQPSDSSIDASGFQVKWQNWKFQWSMDPVQGLQLYHIRYFADGEERLLIYKISLSEIFVPYGPTGETWRFRAAFDAGEYGIGKDVSPLMLGKDVPANTKLFSCPLLDDTTGEVEEVEGCVGIYERDVVLYTHYAKDNNFHEAKTGTEMVITFMATISNYDYMFEYIFSMDGNIMVHLMATGILLSQGVIHRKNDPNCIEDCQDYIHEHTIGPCHQHFFCYRIDFDIDGPSNILTEVELVQSPRNFDNLDGGAFSLKRTVINQETYLDHCTDSSRFWSVINTHSRNKFNTPRGYSIQPANLPGSFLKNSNTLNLAKFISHPIWVTAYNDDEQSAAGKFPRSGKRDQGLPSFIKNRESIRDRDTVLWHSFGMSHATRPEEHPFMNAMGIGFHIMSRNFQSSNPMVEVKESGHHGH